MIQYYRIILSGVECVLSIISGLINEVGSPDMAKVEKLERLELPAWSLILDFKVRTSSPCIIRVVVFLTWEVDQSRGCE